MVWQRENDTMISIIMPVLNGSDTIKESIKSVIGQAYRNWELIIIDGGSEDSTIEICEYWCKQDARIKLIKIQSSGVVESREVGVKVSKGEYIAFIDADDKMHSDMLEKLVCEIKETNADIVSCGYVDVTVNGAKKNCNPIFSGVCDENKFFECLFQSGTLGFLWNKLYKREIYQEAAQPYNLAFCEDLYINCSILLKPRRVSILQECLYDYLVNTSSVTRTMDKKVASNGEWKYLNAYKEIEKLCVNHKDKLRRVEEAKWWVIKLGIEELAQVEGYDIAKRKLLNEMKRSIPKVIKGNWKWKFKVGYCKRYLIASVRVKR